MRLKTKENLLKNYQKVSPDTDWERRLIWRPFSVSVTNLRRGRIYAPLHWSFRTLQLCRQHVGGLVSVQLYLFTVCSSYRLLQTTTTTLPLSWVTVWNYWKSDFWFTEVSESQTREVSEVFPPLCARSKIQTNICGNFFPWSCCHLAASAMKSCTKAHICGQGETTVTERTNHSGRSLRQT